MKKLIGALLVPVLFASIPPGGERLMRYSCPMEATTVWDWTWVGVVPF
jgi:hypothetical protein